MILDGNPISLFLRDVILCAAIAAADVILEPVCSDYKCPKNCTPKDDPEKIKCRLSGCDTDTCCYYHCEY